MVYFQPPFTKHNKFYIKYNRSHSDDIMGKIKERKYPQTIEHFNDLKGINKKSFLDLSSADLIN